MSHKTEYRLQIIELNLELLRKQSDLLLMKVSAIMATQAELTAQLNKISAQLVKIGTETTTLLKTIDDLKVVIATAPVTPELQAAVDKVAAQAQVVDDAVPDVP